MLQDEKERKILRRIDLLEDDLVSLAQDLVKIQSISGHEKDVQSFINSKLLETGFSVNVFSKDTLRPNLVAKLGGGRRNIIFIAHVDNIPAGNKERWTFPPYSASIADGRIHGRGVADMKSGLAAMIIAARALNETEGGTEGVFSIASVVDEEIESEYGMKYLAENHLISADAAIFGEPSFPDIVVSMKGGVWLKITTFGKSVGSGWPQDGINAVTKMSKILLELENLNLGGNSDPLLGPATIAPGTTINCESRMHSIPDRCEATVEIYMNPGQQTEDILEKVEAALSSLKKKDKELEYRVATVFETAPYEISQGERIYKDLQSSISTVFGREATKCGIPSVGDARFMRDLGIPCVIAYGPGEKGKGHITDESVKIETLVNVAKVYALTALRFWSS